MCWTKFKTIEHSSKNFGPSLKTLRTPWCPKLVTCLKEACVKKKHCSQKSAFLEPMLLLNRDGFRWGRSPTLKSKKVTLFTMILYNSEDNISKPIPNKTFVMFELSYFSRYKVILSSIVFSQQCSEVYFISSYSSETVMKLTTAEISHLNVTSWTRPCLLRAKLRSTPPDHLHSEISFWCTCNHKCRSKQNFGVRRIFARISPNLPKKSLCGFCLQIVSYKDHELKTFFGVTSKKAFICFSANLERNFFEVKQHWAPSLPGLSTNQNCWGQSCNLAYHTIACNLPYHWKNTKTRRSYLN